MNLTIYIISLIAIVQSVGVATHITEKNKRVSAAINELIKLMF